VDRGGVLRWITTESIARALYGPQWNRMVDDMSDDVFQAHRIGAPITNPSSFDPETLRIEVVTWD
jgi:hypothetical protein